MPSYHARAHSLGGGAGPTVSRSGGGEPGRGGRTSGASARGVRLVGTWAGHTGRATKWEGKAPSQGPTPRKIAGRGPNIKVPFDHTNIITKTQKFHEGANLCITKPRARHNTSQVRWHEYSADDHISIAL